MFDTLEAAGIKVLDGGEYVIYADTKGKSRRYSDPVDKDIAREMVKQLAKTVKGDLGDGNRKLRRVGRR